METANPSDAVFLVVFAVAALFAYLFPAALAVLRGHRSAPAIVAVCVLLGWSGFGWLWAFVWSLTDTGRR